ncbi:unnamed protein product [Parnassius apollo]|uniref:(apollo) hypothetical protein n=1 Tax=Parnassius apollo TaxID=110799 RepID=A0A8S3W7Z2_PARAO|nr:unnamed protein product [Parnassius apollo]
MSILTPNVANMSLGAPANTAFAMPGTLGPLVTTLGSPPFTFSIFRLKARHVNKYKNHLSITIKPNCRTMTVQQEHAPCAVPALSYLDLSLAAVARASDLTESVVLELLNERVVEKVDEKEEPKPRPRVAR